MADLSSRLRLFLLAAARFRSARATYASDVRFPQGSPQIFVGSSLGEIFGELPEGVALLDLICNDSRCPRGLGGILGSPGRGPE